MEWARCIVLYLTFFWRFFWRFLLLLQTQIQIQTPQNLLQPKILLNRKVSGYSSDTKMKNVLDFLHKGSFQKTSLLFWEICRILTNTNPDPDPWKHAPTKNLIKQKSLRTPQGYQKKKRFGVFYKGSFFRKFSFFWRFWLFSSKHKPRPRML